MAANNASTVVPATRPMQSAAVLVPIYRDAGGRIRLILVQRADHGVHAGQIALPGGKPEAGDNDLSATAMREAAEETGMARPHIQLLSNLPAIITQTSHFRIHPFLAWITPPPRWRCDEREITAVLDLPATDLCAPDMHVRTDIRLPDGHVARDRPCLALQPAPIWGATYRILAPLLPALSAPHVRWFPPCHPGQP